MRKGYKNIAKIFSAGIIYLLSVQQLAAQHMGTNYLSGTPVNFVRTWDATAPEQDANTLMVRPLKDVREATQYFDGLGRPLQTVIRKGSMVTGNPPSDLVNPVEYDAFGREQYKYLPYKASVDNGSFKSNPFTEQANFYNSSTNPYSPIYGQGETFFYSKTNFEPSPLNRVTDTYAPGNSWAGSETNAAAQQRNVQVKYAINTATDAVRIWTVTNNATIGVFGTYSSTPSANYTAVYDAGQLYKTITTDEHKKQVIEFKDKEGKVILKKVQLTATADDGTGSGYDGWLCTYYIYDDFGNLRCVIQPEGVKAILPTWSLTAISNLLDEQCFRYEYDQRNRIIKKKVPGAAAVSMVYDARDRVVLTQDGNLVAQGKWMYTTYDELNRPVATGLWASALTWAQHAANAAGSTSYPTLSGEEELTRTFYNDYNWLSSYSNPLPASYNSSYDSYFQNASNSTWPYPQANAQSTSIKGMATGSRIKVLGTANTYLYTVSFYDDKGRVIQTQGTNITGGTDIATTQYTWAGQPLVTVQKQEKAGTNAQTTVVVNQMTYDDLGRLLKTEKKVSNTLVNSNAMPAYKTIVQNEYNALGQLKNKKLAPQFNSNAGLETLTYDYNIRGWLLGTNRDYAKDGSSSNYFGFDLGYDKVNNNIVGNQTYNIPQYNGNIEGMVWKSKGDGEKRKYDFAYDAANRLLKADFTQYSGSIFDQSAGVNFNVKMGDGSDASTAYDANGNIKRMQQWGLKINASVQIDDLSYTYQSGSNKLQQVTDAFNDYSSTLGDFKYEVATKTATDYIYDDNGNLTSDANKKLTNISYNYLNLPNEITKPSPTDAGGGTITYVYDATGNKLQKIVNGACGHSCTTVTTTTYINGFVYGSKVTSPTDPASPDYSDVLQLIPQEEGRIRFKPATGTTAAGLQYDYMLKDHLGNVRMVLTEEQQQDKYPVASLEDAKLATEQQYYTIDNTKIVAANTVSGLPAYTNDNGIGNNPSDPAFEGTNSSKLYKLNSSTNKTGLGITLKVMAGDKLDVFGKSYYFTNNPGSSYNNTVPILDLLSGFLGSPGASSTTAVHGAVTASGINTTAGTAGINSMITAQTSQNSANSSRPRAFINVIFFDEQFKAVDYKISMVGDNSQLKNHYADLQNLSVPKNGFVYIYCSNETPVDVFFDNIQVVHNRGAILEETHYYPFGLTMTGISSRAAGKLENKRLFNDGTELQSKEFSDGSGLELYATDFRSYDPQLGRLWQIDPLCEITDGVSPYAYCSNNPILLNDPTGLLGDTTINGVHYPDNKKLNEVVITSKKPTVNQVINKTSEGFNWVGLGWGAYEMGRQLPYGDYNYKASSGVVQSIFDTKWGANKSPGNLGNISNYSKNAQAAISGTKVVKILKVGGKIFIWVGVGLDGIKLINALSKGDPKAGEYARKMGLNTGVAIGSAAIPVVGWMIGGIYFLGDAFIPKDANGVGGWERGMEASRQNVENNRKIDPAWSPRPMGGL